MDVKHFKFEGHKIAYKSYGEGKRVVVLVHGLLFNQEMHAPLARALAEHGNRVITIDMVGHGKSDQPAGRFDMTRYSHAVISLLDRLDIPEAVIGGTSLGANIGLEAAVHHPERVRGLIVDMPSLEQSIVGAAAIFTPILLGAQYAEPIVRTASRLMRLIPVRTMPYSANLVLDLMKRDPRITGDVLKGIYVGRIAPPREERMEIEAPALIIGHKFDPVHQFGDAVTLAKDMPNSHLVEARSILELRLMPARLTKEIVEFVDECWKPRAVQRTRDGATPTASRPAGGRAGTRRVGRTVGKRPPKRSTS